MCSETQHLVELIVVLADNDVGDGVTGVGGGGGGVDAPPRARA